MISSRSMSPSNCFTLSSGVSGLIASPAADACDLLTALAETVLRERGFTVLEIGCVTEPSALAEVISEQRPHQVVLLADRETDATLLAGRIEGIGRLVVGRGSELWLAGTAPWPAVEGARRFPTLSELDSAAARSNSNDGSRTAHSV